MRISPAPPMMSLVTGPSRIALRLALLAATVTAAGCTGYKPEPYTTSDQHSLPGVVLSAEHESATIRFTLDLTPEAEPLETVIPLGQWEPFVSAAASLNGNQLTPDDNRVFRCTGNDCLGEYEIKLDWVGGASGEVIFESRISVDFESGPPRYPRSVFSVQDVDADVVVVAEGRASARYRSWVALRGPQGFSNLSRFTLEVEGDEARIIAAAGVEHLGAGRHNQRLALPDTCRNAGCGAALMIEYDVASDFPSEGSVEWRILDTKPSGLPLRVDNRSDDVPFVRGETWIAFQLRPGEVASRTVRVTVPNAVLGEMDPQRPVYLDFDVHPTMRDSNIVPGITITDAGGTEHAVAPGDYLSLPLAGCKGRPTTCETELGLDVASPSAAGEDIDVTVNVSATALLPHLVLQPQEVRVLLVEEAP